MPKYRYRGASAHRRSLGLREERADQAPSASELKARRVHWRSRRAQPLLVVLGGLLSLTLWLGTSSAAQADGRFFFLEGQVGPVFHGGVGTGASLAFGAGGKLRGSTLRAYFLLEAGGSHSQQGAAATVQDTDRLYGQLGARLLWPLRHTPVSILMEGLVGGSDSDATLQRPNGIELSGGGAEWMVSGGLGLQIRMIQALSITLRTQAQYNPDPLADLRRELGLQRSATFFTATGGLTWHF